MEQPSVSFEMSSWYSLACLSLLITLKWYIIGIVKWFDISVSGLSRNSRVSDCGVCLKARRKTATAEDLLFAGASDGSHLAAAAANPVVMTAARGPVVVEPAVNAPLIPTRSAAVVEQRGSPPERDYSLVPPTKTATSRVNRSPRWSLSSHWIHC